MLFSKTVLALFASVAAVSATPLLEARQSCTSSYTVVSGDFCNLISQKTGVAVATIESLNPSINSGCTNLQIGQVLCLATGGSSGSGSINGIATYYDPNGGFGACGNVLTNDMFVAALNPGDYASGAHCGRTISVQYQGRTVNAVVQDLCPGCQGDHGIDLTEPAMSTIDSNYIFDGHIAVTWNLSKCSKWFPLGEVNY
ncbi:RlpA-like double-psi beta-barrel-protein domain-containing protein-containing protein [Roridomyces roridus]|uniref:RlpA-like double-psi beta-barrel-protein domain-containing protein-containing protein n=1 Tax=Roridomyces roridus TaxID=1738132 RepID=A0AAD7BIR2_9AGAR|nr:RlpA-like double-psi beta-barrel-protein domain-containing protein-containing protein [Roridomyces roridus]